MALSIQRDVPLTEYNTYCLPGRASFLAVARSPEDVVEACRFARRENLPRAVLGSGSNVIIDDGGYPGVLVVNRIDRMERLSGNRLLAGAGVLLRDLLEFAAGEGLAGLGRLAGIPGTLGGALFGNAGAFGMQIGAFVEEIGYVDAGCRPTSVPGSACGFSYRDSAFKRGEIPGIITSAVLRLEAGAPEEIRRTMTDTLQAREGKHPPGASCGSYFKNLEVDRLDPSVKERLAGWIAHDRIPAGRLIEEAGGKGLRIGGAYVSERHGNFLLNDGSATASDLKELSRLVKQRVWERFGVRLEEEVRYL